LQKGAKTLNNNRKKILGGILAGGLIVGSFVPSAAFGQSYHFDFSQRSSQSLKLTVPSAEPIVRQEPLKSASEWQQLSLSNYQIEREGNRIIIRFNWQRPTADREQLPLPQPLPQPPEPKPAPPAAENKLTAVEQEMIRLVNLEREKAGLKPLAVDYNLVKTARMKSLDMLNNNYFAHQSPTYGSPFDLMRSQGVSYRLAGENLAGAPSVERAHQALMNSPGHRANILNPEFTHLGIGAAPGGPYGIYFTQHFVGR